MTSYYIATDAAQQTIEAADADSAIAVATSGRYTSVENYANHIERVGGTLSVQEDGVEIARVA